MNNLTNFERFKDRESYQQALFEMTQGQEKVPLVKSGWFSSGTKANLAKMTEAVEKNLDYAKKQGFIQSQFDTTRVNKLKARLKLEPQPLVSTKTLVGGALVSGAIALGVAAVVYNNGANQHALDVPCLDGRPCMPEEDPKLQFPCLDGRPCMPEQDPKLQLPLPKPFKTQEDPVQGKNASEATGASNSNVGFLKSAQGENASEANGASNTSVDFLKSAQGENGSEATGASNTSVDFNTSVGFLNSAQDTPLEDGLGGRALPLNLTPTSGNADSGFKKWIVSYFTSKSSRTPISSTLTSSTSNSTQTCSTSMEDGLGVRALPPHLTPTQRNALATQGLALVTPETCEDSSLSNEEIRKQELEHMQAGLGLIYKGAGWTKNKVITRVGEFLPNVPAKSSSTPTFALSNEEIRKQVLEHIKSRHLFTNETNNQLVSKQEGLDLWIAGKATEVATPVITRVGEFLYNSPANFKEALTDVSKWASKVTVEDAKPAVQLGGISVLLGIFLRAIQVI